MKRIYTYILLMACAVLFAGCQKEVDSMITAVIEDYEGNDGKVYLDDANYACWHNRDKVFIFKNGDWDDFKSVSCNETIAQIDMGSILELGDVIDAIYSSSRNQDQSVFKNGEGGSINFPILQYQLYEKAKTPNGVSVQKIDAPMVAHTTIKSGENQLKFYNTGSLMKLTLQNPSTKNIVLNEVELIATTTTTEGGMPVLNGTMNYKLEEDGTFSQLKSIPSSFSSAPCNNVILNFDYNGSYSEDRTIVASGSMPVYIAIPPVESAFTVKVKYVEEGGRELFCYTKVGQSVKNIERNKLVNMGILKLENSESLGVSGLEGTGEPGNPFKITCAADLKFMAEKVASGASTGIDWTKYNDAHYEQTASFTLDESFPGIGDASNYAFMGHYTANADCTITNNSKHSIFNYVGNGAVIDGLNVVVNVINPDVSKSNKHYGGIVGYAYTNNEPLVIRNCHVSGSISASYSDYNQMGGICGYMDKNGNFNKSMTIENCTNSASITREGTPNGPSGNFYASGILGKTGVSVDIIGCTNNGNITAVDCGGIVGVVNENGLVNKCVNNGKITLSQQYEFNDKNSGGIAGIVRGTVINCANHGTVVYGGGLVGTCDGNLLNSYSDGTGISYMITMLGGDGRAYNAYFDGGLLINENNWGAYSNLYRSKQSEGDTRDGNGDLYNKGNYTLYGGDGNTSTDNTLLNALSGFAIPNTITLPQGVEKEVWKDGGNGKPKLDFEQ